MDDESFARRLQETCDGAMHGFALFKKSDEDGPNSKKQKVEPQVKDSSNDPPEKDSSDDPPPATLDEDETGAQEGPREPQEGGEWIPPGNWRYPQPHDRHGP